MKVGCFTNIEHGKNFEYQIARISKLGFTCADIAESHSGGFLGSTYGFVPAISLDDNPKRILRMFEKHGIELSDVCAHSNLLDPSTPALFGTAEIMKAIKLAAVMGVHHVITTEGEPETAWGKALSRKESIFITAEKLQEPIMLAQDLGVTILLENHGPITDSIDGIEALLEKLGNPENIGLCLDTGNSWLGGADPVEMAKTFKEKIGHIHWKDLEAEWESKRGKIYGCPGANIALGNGVIDVKGVFEVLKDSSLIKYSTLEVKGEKNLLESYAFLKSLGAE